MKTKMKLLSMLSLALVLLLGSCKKDDDPKFTSAEGDWTYTTPDNHIVVGFTLTKSGTDWSVTKPTIVVDGVSGNAEVEVAGVTPPSINYIKINANDSKLVYAYHVAFAVATVSDDFTKITVSNADYTWPYNKVNNTGATVIVRK